MSVCPTDLDDLVVLSRAGSSAPMLVQGPGGNASIKSADGQSLYVKASGFRLSEVSADTGYVTVDLGQAAAVLESAELASLRSDEAHLIAARRIADALAGPKSLRASLETPFHSMFDRCVLHTHAVYANAFACMENGIPELERIYGEPVCSVPYYAPGYALGRAVHEAVYTHARVHGRTPHTVLLENHGLITSGPDVANCVEATAKVLAAGEKYFGKIQEQSNCPNPPGDDAAGWAADLASAYARRTGRMPATKAVTNGVLRRAVHDPLGRLLSGHLCPDEAVFFQNNIRVCPPGVAAPQWLEYFDPVPPHLVAVIVDRAVVLVAPNSRKLQGLEESLIAHALVVELIGRVGRARTLLPEDADYLLSMEEEQYRQTLGNVERV